MSVCEFVRFHYYLNLTSDNKGIYEGALFKDFSLKTELMYWEYEKIGLMYYDILSFDLYIDWLTNV